MEEISVLTKSRIPVDETIRTNHYRTRSINKRTRTNPIIENLIAEGGDTFFNYLNCHGLDNEPNLLVLPSKHHYYYEVNELKGVTTLINMKKLNLIKHLDIFLHVLYSILSPKANFIGCFSDRKSQTGINIPSRIYKRFINFLDNKIEIEIDKEDVSRLLESIGFKIIDMTEINGLTYFNTRKNGDPVKNPHEVF